MRAFPFSPKPVLLVAGLALPASFVLLLQPLTTVGTKAPGRGLGDEIRRMRSALPIDLGDGSVLHGIETLDGRLVLTLTADDRLDLAAVRDGGRREKCAVWRSALRDREASVVEYRYRQTGATASLFLDRTVCG